LSQPNNAVEPHARAMPQIFATFLIKTPLKRSSIAKECLDVCAWPLKPGVIKKLLQTPLPNHTCPFLAAQSDCLISFATHS
jgi:hypothetical protein